MREPTTMTAPEALMNAAGAPDRFKVPSADLLASMPDQVKRAEDRRPAFAKPMKLTDPWVLKMHRDLYGHYLRELDIHAENRRQMEKDEAYYDHDQWEPEDIEVLRARGQEPLVMNVIAQSINWILGTERRGRTDFKILPRQKEGSKAAEHKSALLKYIADCSRSDFHNSRAFSDTVKVGVGWLECGVQAETEGEPIYERYESWRSIIWDTAAQELDLEDGRYQFRSKWLDLDTAEDMFPDAQVTLREASHRSYEIGASLDRHGDEHMDAIEEFRDRSYGTTRSDEFENPERQRVRTIEAWFKKSGKEKRLAGGQFGGELFDPGSIGHHIAISSGESRLITAPTFRTHVMLMCAAGPLWCSPSPYRHNKYPFTPIWAYRRGKDGMPYGVIRGMRDAQRDINKRLSKALAILSSSKVIMDKGAVANLDEFEEEISRPDSIIVKEPGKELKIDVDRELSAAHLNLMQMSMGMIQSLSGVTDESLGRTTNAVSGKAVLARQEQGALATAPVFDNLRLGRQIHGEKLLSLTEQFMGEQKQFRITNRRGQASYVKINDPLLPESDIVSTKADFIISEDDWNSTLRQSQVESLLELLMKLAPTAPQIVLALIDLVVEAMDVPAREEIVKRIRSVTGMEDPDADPNSPDPERDAREMAKAEEQAKASRAQEAEISKLEGEAAEKKARAAKTEIEAKALLAKMPADSITRKREALLLAIDMLNATPALDVADDLLAQGDEELAAMAPQAPPVMPPAPPMPGAAPAPGTQPMPM